MKKLMKIVKNEDGQALALAAIVLVVLMGIAALVVDIGFMYLTKSKLQSAADLAALSAAQDLPSSDTAINNAIYCAAHNGVKESEITVTAPYNGDSSMIEVVCIKNVQLTFARVFGLNSGTVKATAVAQRITAGGDAFNYAVFAGSGEVRMTGGKHTICGSVYGRDGVDFNGNNNDITGNADYYNGFVSVRGMIEGTTNKVSSPIDMPDFTSIIKSRGIVCTQSDINDIVSKGKSVDGPIYVNGDLTINGRIKGIGIICTSGTISLSENQDPTDSICFYSANGDITFNGGTGNVYGIIYAPNGNATINGGPNGDVHGRIIAKTVTVHGSKFNDISTSHDLAGMNSLSVIKLVQ